MIYFNVSIYLKCYLDKPTMKRKGYEKRSKEYRL